MVVGVIASGGTETFFNDYKIHTFTSSGTFVVTQGGYVEYLVVAGGGGGASGGGGGGGVTTGILLLTPGNKTVTVGLGGNGVAHNATGNNGQDSLFDSIVALGGGRGGKIDTQSDAGSGGSGGGGGASSTLFPSGGLGAFMQGYSGGTTGIKTSPFPSAGGGGRGAVGNGPPSASQSGAGGVGTELNISGSSVYYAGGGGGGLPDAGSGSPGAGGTGGGGAGGNNGSAVSGTANTGGGGGGTGALGVGGTGGSGIVIVRYLTNLKTSLLRGRSRSRVDLTSVSGG